MGYLIHVHVYALKSSRPSQSTACADSLLTWPCLDYNFNEHYTIQHTTVFLTIMSLHN